MVPSVEAFVCKAEAGSPQRESLHHPVPALSLRLYLLRLLTVHQTPLVDLLDEGEELPEQRIPAIEEGHHL